MRTRVDKQKPPVSAAAPAIVHQVLQAPGQPPESAGRAPLEPRFGHDFSGVRVHADARAAESARAVDASAHTEGRSIAPHVVQQDGPGHPLAGPVREDLESRFGHDFSRVRIHTDARADESARAMGAQAFTVGEHVAFRTGRYAPHTREGRKLLAHELTHHVQQTGQLDQATPAFPSMHSAGPVARASAAEAEADRNAERVAAGARAHVNVTTPAGVAMNGDGSDSAADRSFWFQNKPPEKPVTHSSGIEITPKGQVFLDPSVPSIASESLGTLRVQFAGLDTDFPAGAPTPAFAAAEKAVLAAITDAVGDLGALPDIKGAASMKAARAQRRQDEIARARLKEAARSLSGKTLNVFIATDLSVAEKLSLAPLSLRTEQIFVRAADIGDAKKLEGAIRVPLVALTGGVKGLAAGPDGTLTESSVKALTAEQAKEGILHEMVHVMLINKGLSAGQVWQGAKAGVVSGPDQVKSLAEDVLFRYVRAQEEIFVYSAIAGVYTGFAANKDRYTDFVKLVEAFLHDIGAKVDVQKPAKIDVKERIGEGKRKEGVTWSIAYTLPKPMKIDAAQLDALKFLQRVDAGS